MLGASLCDHSDGIDGFPASQHVCQLSVVELAILVLVDEVVDIDDIFGFDLDLGSLQGRHELVQSQSAIAICVSQSQQLCNVTSCASLKGILDAIKELVEHGSLLTDLAALDVIASLLLTSLFVATGFLLLLLPLILLSGRFLALGWNALLWGGVSLAPSGQFLLLLFLLTELFGAHTIFGSAFFLQLALRCLHFDHTRWSLFLIVDNKG